MSSGTREPLYLQIQDYFKNQISSNQLAPHEQIPTEKEIMEKFNVSRITVTNALAELVNEGLIYRIPGKGSFVQEGVKNYKEKVEILADKTSVPFEEITSHNQVHSERKIIGLIMPSIEDYFAIRLLAGINEVLNETEYILTIILSHNSREKEREAIRELLKLNAVGLLIFPVDAEIYNEDILELKVRNFPFVLMDRYLPGVETNYVISNNIDGAKLAVEHLWDMGHRNIAICSDSILPTITVEDRIKGYMDALKERDAMINPSFILTDLAIKQGESNDQNLLNQFIRNRKATAYIALNAKLGVHIAKFAKNFSLNIPEDISIVTFDNPSFDDDFGTYTHIFQSEQTIGKEAANILVQILEERRKSNVPSFEKKSISPKLVVKETTGPVNKNF
ncbi:GntR family transcriptional regulator [Lederbergia wuyishanensis]|uniref:GntR family transcriptional regulator of arabinose operon n=1 Tax=Lederbergia wuyishanensis TaxID=1347903 RepID=A0ABU0D9I0_9BACI|nr:GntR family transcriptional regulator [Lederbergia wuyishanensis]MCJ8007482.1 GntR family transcriptional regulator [Lederbergia wuyishanensis]MDQ0345079.1 GntR family transcriptional regulator of arabinose operon [Lederbergia wuyishanensis]